MRETWRDQCRDWLAKYDPAADHMDGDPHEPMSHYAFIRKLSEELPANAIIVSDTGGNVIMMGHAFRSKQGQRIFTSNGNTPMGFALCGAIGAWFAEPERPVICIIGDGGLQLNIQELQTTKHYGCKVKVFVINNGVLGNTKSYQRVNGKAELACGPDGYSAPDFSAIATAYGLYACHIGMACQYESVIKVVLGLDGPVICDVINYDACTYEPRMSRWDCPIEEMHPALPEAEFLDNMKISPLDGWENRR